METRPEDKHTASDQPAAKIDKAEDKKISRGFWRYVIIGYAIGMAIGAAIFVFLLFTMNRMELRIPVIFMIAALAQIGTGGGLVGAGIYVSKMIDRDDDDEDNDDTPGGGNKAPAHRAKPARAMGLQLQPKLSGATG